MAAQKVGNLVAMRAVMMIAWMAVLMVGQMVED